MLSKKKVLNKICTALIMQAVYLINLSGNIPNDLFIYPNEVKQTHPVEVEVLILKFNNNPYYSHYRHKFLTYHPEVNLNLQFHSTNSSFRP